MENRYWEKFMHSGSVKDYLSYKENMKKLGHAENMLRDENTNAANDTGNHPQRNALRGS